jgi:hypothetical protein
MHGAEFNAQVMKERRQPLASVTAVALAHVPNGLRIQIQGRKDLCARARLFASRWSRNRALNL